MCWTLPQIAQTKQDALRRAYKGPIVVLSEKDKAWMDAEIEAALQDGPPLKVTRHVARSSSLP